MGISATALAGQARALDDAHRALLVAARPRRGSEEASLVAARDQVASLAEVLQPSSATGWARTALRAATRAQELLAGSPGVGTHADELTRAATMIGQARQGALHRVVDSVAPGIPKALGSARRADALMQRVVARGDSGGSSGADVDAIRRSFATAQLGLRAAAANPAIPIDARWAAHAHANLADVISTSLGRFEGAAYTGDLGRTIDTAHFFSGRVTASARSLANRALHELEAGRSAEWAPQGHSLEPVKPSHVPDATEATVQRTEAAIARGATDGESQRVAALLEPDVVSPRIPAHDAGRPELDPADAPLPPGLHRATWSEFTERFGSTPRREELLESFRAALVELRAAGVDRVHVGGSFVRTKAAPGDIDLGLLIDPHHSLDGIRDVLGRHWDAGIHGYFRSTSDNLFASTRSGVPAGRVELDLASLTGASGA